MTSQEYWPESVSTRGLRVRLKMNGDLVPVTGDMVTVSLSVAGVQTTVTFTSVSTEGGSEAVQVRVREVPTYKIPLERLKVTLGGGTAGQEGNFKMHASMHLETY